MLAAEEVQPPSVGHASIRSRSYLLQRRYRLAKLANMVAVRVGRSLMVPVFSRAPSKPRSKTMNCMVLAAVVPLPRSVAPRDWLGRL